MNGKSKVFTVANVIMAMAFFYFMYLQFNDEDPIRWCLIYGISGLACIVYLTGRLHWTVPATIGVVALGWALSKIPALWGQELPLNQVFGTMQMISTSIKECREMLGLSVVFFWMAFLTFFVRKYESQSPL